MPGRGPFHVIMTHVIRTVYMNLVRNEVKYKVYIFKIFLSSSSLYEKTTALFHFWTHTAHNRARFIYAVKQNASVLKCLFHALPKALAWNIGAKLRRKDFGGVGRNMFMTPRF